MYRQGDVLIVPVPPSRPAAIIHLAGVGLCQVRPLADPSHGASYQCRIGSTIFLRQ